MDYPITQSIVEHLLAGFRQTNERQDKLETKVAAALAKLPMAQRQALSTDDIFAGAALIVSTSRELRLMTGNPAFKVEPVISQLRRAEAAYVEAHDAYLDDPDNGLRIEEMRWAHGRLTIARQFYDGVMASLPPKKRAAIVSHPVNGSRIAVKDLTLATFSDEEQRALRLAITDREAAIDQIDQIIAAGRASSRDLRVIHAYLIDPAARGQIERWLVDQSAASRAAPAEERFREESAGTGVEAGSTNPSDSRAGVAIVAAQDTHADGPIDPKIRHAIDVIDGWLNKLPAMLDHFVRVDALWRINVKFKAPVYAAAYDLAVEHPQFQRMIDGRKSQRIAAGDVPADRS